MSQDIVAAIASTDSTDASGAMERHRVQMDAVDLRTLDTAPNGGADIQMPSVAPEAASSAMNLQALAGKFTEGMQNGFYASDMDRLMGKLVKSKEPGSNISFGDVSVELLNVQAKVGIADAFSKVTTKLAEGLQTMVVKQG